MILQSFELGRKTLHEDMDRLYEVEGAGLCVLYAARARKGEPKKCDRVAYKLSILNSKLDLKLCQPNVSNKRIALINNALWISGCTRGHEDVHLYQKKGDTKILWYNEFQRFFSASVCDHKIVESPPSLPTSYYSSPSHMLYFRSCPTMLYYPSFN